MPSQGFVLSRNYSSQDCVTFQFCFHTTKRSLCLHSGRAPVESLNIFGHVLKAHPRGKDLIYQSGINNVDIALGVTSSPCRSENSRSIALLHFKILLRHSSDRILCYP